MTTPHARHVSNQHAVAFAMNQGTLVRFNWCEGCDSWVPRVAETK